MQGRRFLLGIAVLLGAILAGHNAVAQDRFHTVNLQPQANQKLSDDFHGYVGNNLKPLPRGRQTFEEVRFEIGESMIQLASKRAPDFPEKAEGIQVGSKADQLHFLHGTGWVVSEGTLIGSYVIHYADNTKETIPIEYGNDVRDWWTLVEDDPAARAKTVWKSVNDASKDFRGGVVHIRLFLRTWENPHPGKKIETITFSSRNETISAPFLIAVTAEAKAYENGISEQMEPTEPFMEPGQPGASVAKTNANEKEIREKLEQNGALIETGQGGAITKVSLSGPGLVAGTIRGTDDDLLLVAELPNLRILYLNSSSITNDGLEALEETSSLRWLSLNMTQIGDTGLKHLAPLTQLERLRLYRTPITDAGLESLAEMENLKVLDLSHTAITDRGLKVLAGLKSLEKLDLSGTQVTEEGVAQLKEQLSPKVEIDY